VPKYVPNDHHHKPQNAFPMDEPANAKIEYGVTPTHVMAAMSGLGLRPRHLRGQAALAADHAECRAVRFHRREGHVMFHSVPGFRHYNPIGSVHGGYAAILLDSAMGLAVHTALPAGTGYTTLEFKISFIKGMTRDNRPCPHRGQDAQCRPPRRDSGSTHHRRQRPAARACDDDVSGFRDS
jgi:Thioesterase superfamily